MFKKTVLTLALSLMMIPFSPAAGICWDHPAPYWGYHHGHHGGDGWAWGLGGLLVGSAITAALLYQPPPPPERVVYAAPPPPPPAAPIYTYPPEVPPGMCRWERYLLDNYGRLMLDQNGEPIKEYTLGSCQYPPN